MAVVTPTRVDGVRRTTITWTTVGIADTGAPIDTADLEDIKCLQVVGTGSPQMNASNDGTNFASMGAALTANSIANVTLGANKIGIASVATAAVTVILSAVRKAR